MTESAGTPENLSRRRFLTKVGMTGGAAALYGSLEALGLVATTANAETVDFVPPSTTDLAAAGRRKKVAILGAGTAGLTIAYELGKPATTATSSKPAAAPAVAHGPYEAATNTPTPTV